MSSTPLSPTANGSAPPEWDEKDFVHDWNAVEKHGPIIHSKFTIHDETLRDGIQSPSVTDPKI